MIRKSGHCPYVGSVVLCTENIVSSNMTCCWSLLSEWVKHVTYFGPSQHSDSSTVLTTGVEFPGGTKFLATAGFFFYLSDTAGCCLGVKAAGAWNLRPLSVCYTHFTHTFSAVRGTKGQQTRSLLCLLLRYVLFTVWSPRQWEGPLLRVTLVKTVPCSIGFHKDTGQKIWLRAQEIQQSEVF